MLSDMVNSDVMFQYRDVIYTYTRFRKKDSDAMCFVMFHVCYRLDL